MELPNFEVLVAQARETEGLGPPPVPLPQAELEARQEFTRLAQLAAESARLATMTSVVLGEAADVSRQLLAKSVEPEFGIVDTSKISVGQILRTGPMTKGPRTLGQALNPRTSPASSGQERRKAGRKQRYLERRLHLHTTSGWGTSGDGALGSNGKLYRVEDATLFTTRLRRTSNQPQGLRIVEGWGSLVLTQEQDVYSARQGLARLAARYELDVTRIG